MNTNSQAPLAWGAKVSPLFRSRVFDICYRLSWDDEHPSWLMSCMQFETGGTFKPNVVNLAGSKAVGLIQFMEPTAIGLGTTPAELMRMSAEDQLRFVELYFKPYASRIHTLTDLYMAILLPKYIGQPDGSVLFTGGTTAYRQNSGLDANTDGRITKAEATAKVAASLTRGLLEGNVWNSSMH